MLGDFKNPVAVGLKRDLWANLDAEFFQILEIWRWHRSAKLIDLNTLPYHLACGVRYLIEEDYANNRLF